MDILKKIAVAFVSVVLLASLLLLTLSLSLNQLLYPDIYRNAFENNGGDQFISENIGKIPMLNFIALPDDGLKGLIFEKLGNFLAYLRYDSDSLDLRIQLNRNELMKFIEQSAHNVPVCRSDADFSWDNVTCRPSNVSAKEFIGIYIEKKNPDMQSIEYYDLRNDIDKGNNIPKIREYFRDYRMAHYFVVFLCILLVLALYLFNREFPKYFLRVTGVISLASGAIGFVIGMFSAKIGTVLLENTFSNPNSPVFLKPMVSDIMLSVINRLELICFLLIGIGSVLFILSFFIGGTALAEKAAKKKN